MAYGCFFTILNNSSNHRHYNQLTDMIIRSTNRSNLSDNESTIWQMNIQPRLRYVSSKQNLKVFINNINKFTPQESVLMLKVDYTTLPIYILLKFYVYFLFKCETISHCVHCTYLSSCRATCRMSAYYRSLITLRHVYMVNYIVTRVSCKDTVNLNTIMNCLYQ